MVRQRSWIEEANNLIHIADLLTHIGIAVPGEVRSGGSKKVHCPFGFYHSDGGLSKAMRVYGQSNTAYCFSCSKRYSPVSLASAKWDCSWNSAALRLLEDAGFKPKTLKERWAEATTPVEKKVDLIALADALKTYCSTVDENWTQHQYSDEVATKLSKCLELLSMVKTDEQATKWLLVCKSAMKAVLEEK